ILDDQKLISYIKENVTKLTNDQKFTVNHNKKKIILETANIKPAANGLTIKYEINDKTKIRLVQLPKSKFIIVNNFSKPLTIQKIYFKVKKSSSSSLFSFLSGNNDKKLVL